ncbi:MAG: molybdopterin-dependent oxidoreductase [Candidatus Bathyarchaeota archaeon]
MLGTVFCATCPVCGALCDDIEVTIEDNKIVKVKNACAIGEAKFLNYCRDRPNGPMVRKDGKLVETSWDEAIKKSAEILVNAFYPILYGWSSTSCEAIKKGLELAEEVGGVIDNTSTVCHGPSVLGIHDIGMSSSTLGQIRHRADLIIYWGSNPWGAHPRHTERYTMFVEGRFQGNTWKHYAARSGITQLRKRRQRVSEIKRDRNVPSSNKLQRQSPFTMPLNGRKMIVVDSRLTRSADAADYFLQVKPNSDYEVLQALRMLVRDEELDVDEIAGIPLELLEEVADVMINCELGMLFFGVGLTMSLGKNRNVDAALSLVRDLNRRTKFLIMPMRGAFQCNRCKRRLSLGNWISIRCRLLKEISAVQSWRDIYC